jgi:hypothetical protein
MIRRKNIIITTDDLCLADFQRSLRPSLRSVQDANDLYGLLMNAIDGDVGQAFEN